MSDPGSSQWRQMFERRQEQPPRNVGSTVARPPAPPPPTYDDGYDPTRQTAVPMVPHAMGDEATDALADDPSAYRPWILQRARSRPAMMLHLRRHEPRSDLWSGWAVSYPHLVAVEYEGTSLISLDFGVRHFVLRGSKLGELVDHLQSGTVLCIQQFAPKLWAPPTNGPSIAAIHCITPGSNAGQ